ncbi:hypothetical protein F2P81_018843 [Scophthalmus maximus]|uniref:Uncharacterized protein n=1 Tax=Scophthalmus maximus TaxID=52904 RepID=A0A6A4SBQ8_SCOMX|nr:hypothetical protein F2P81_018843 [Scophthalmus maximus]
MRAVNFRTHRGEVRFRKVLHPYYYLNWEHSVKDKHRLKLSFCCSHFDILHSLPLYLIDIEIFWRFFAKTDSCLATVALVTSQTHGVYFRLPVLRDASIFNPTEVVKFVHHLIIRLEEKDREKRSGAENGSGKCLNGEPVKKKREDDKDGADAEILGTLTAGIVNSETPLPTCLLCAKEN